MTAPDMDKRIGVIIIDDDSLVRSGLALLLGGDARIKVLAEGSDGSEAVELVRRHLPDVVVMDLRMHGVDGVTATRQVLRDAPEVKVLVLTTFESDGSVVAALRAGAMGFVLKDDAPARLAQAIVDVSRAVHAFSPAVTSHLVHRVTADDELRHEARARLEHLTRREREVALALGDGLTNAEIAAHLHVSVPTVKGHISSMLAKTGVSTRVQLALLVRHRD